MHSAEAGGGLVATLAVAATVLRRCIEVAFALNVPETISAFTGHGGESIPVAAVSGHKHTDAVHTIGRTHTSLARWVR